METLDHILYGVEVALVPISLGLLLAATGSARSKPPLWLSVVATLAALAYLHAIEYLPLLALAAGVVILLARLADRRPRLQVLAVPLTVIAALTVAQPLGVHAERIDPADSSPWSGGERVDPSSTQSLQVSGLSIPRFRLFRRERFDPLAGLGECCPSTHDLRVRSWIPPGLLTNGSQITGLCGDGPCWDPNIRTLSNNLRLIHKDGTWYVVLKGSGTVSAWRLSSGVTSRLGVLYWLLAVLGFAAIFQRRRSRPRL